MKDFLEFLLILLNSNEQITAIIRDLSKLIYSHPAINIIIDINKAIIIDANLSVDFFGI